MSFRFTFGRRRSDLPLAATPDGSRIYAIGDVHGCIEQLERLLSAIDADLHKRHARAHLVFLGDLIDRGPNSAAVIERLRSGGLPGETASFLLGNHEEVLLQCYDGNVERCKTWLQYGGLQTLESYGLDRAEIFEKASLLPDIIRRVVPQEHVAFIRSFSDSLQLGDYLFVQAGIRPGVPLHQQSGQDLRWIRSPFLKNSDNHGPVVVHGHTIVQDVEVYSNRIAVDTGCYLSGKLAALVLEGTSKGQLVAKAELTPQAA
jgi:serine/threonine protein phosphatase 1